MAKPLVLVLFGLAAVSALPFDHVVKDLSGDGPRFQYVQRPDGTTFLADLWLKISDLGQAANFKPDRQIIYHLYTRLNPNVSQPLLPGVERLVEMTNFNPGRRTIVCVHGWGGDALSGTNTKLIPAFLAAEDVNVIVVDWSAGAGTLNYIVAVANTVTGGESVARFLNWLNEVSGSRPRMYHLLGHSLGGHFVGIVGRNMDGVSYITSMDPAMPGWVINENKFHKDDGLYTEVIHTNVGELGYLSPLGHVDFYPNGGNNMPGCPSSLCDHNILNDYLPESIVHGGFTGRRCASHLNAIQGSCAMPGTLRMGGLSPNTGASGIYYLETNAEPPYSKG